MHRIPRYRRMQIGINRLHLGPPIHRLPQLSGIVERGDQSKSHRQFQIHPPEEKSYHHRRSILLLLDTRAARLAILPRNDSGSVLDD